MNHLDRISHVNLLKLVLCLVSKIYCTHESRTMRGSRVVPKVREYFFSLFSMSSLSSTHMTSNIYLPISLPVSPSRYPSFYLYLCTLSIIASKFIYPSHYLSRFHVASNFLPIYHCFRIYLSFSPSLTLSCCRQSNDKFA